MISQAEIDGHVVYGSPAAAVFFVADPDTRELEVGLPGSQMFANLETGATLVIAHTNLTHGLLAVHTLYERGQEKVTFRSEPVRVDDRNLIV